MTLRTSSRVEHLYVCVLLAVAAFIVYVIVVMTAHEGEGILSVLRADRMRYFLPVAILFGVFAYETRWDGVVREKRVLSGRQKAGMCRRASSGSPSADVWRSQAQGTASGQLREPVPNAELKLGEMEFRRAQRMPLGRISAYAQDSDYLDLLGKSADSGYAPAMRKLGDYAIRRRAWIEAYYWMWCARRAGELGLDPVLWNIRLSWEKNGFPEERENVYRQFSEKAGNVARALINIDSGRETAVSEAYLKAFGQEFL